MLDDLSSGNTENLEGIADVELVTGFDSRRAVASPKASRGVDAIVHLAARPSVPRSLEDPVATHHANATGTLAVLESAHASARGLM